MKYIKDFKLFELHSDTYRSAADKHKELAGREDNTYKEFDDMYIQRKKQEDRNNKAYVPSEDSKSKRIAKILFKNHESPEEITNWRTYLNIIDLYNNEELGNWNIIEEQEKLYTDINFISFCGKYLYKYLTDYGKYNLVYDLINSELYHIIHYLIKYNGLSTKEFTFDWEFHKYTLISSLFIGEYTKFLPNGSIEKILDMYKISDIKPNDIKELSQYSWRERESILNHPIVLYIREEGEK